MPRGRYEVHYLTLTDPVSGVGAWIRYTTRTPVDGAPEAALWFLTMDPRPGRPPVFARRETLSFAAFDGRDHPLSLSLGPGRLSDQGASGALADCAWELCYRPSAFGYDHIHPLLRRVADTRVTLPQADLSIDGWLEWGGERLELAGARGAQAHLWGTEHARRWAWVHCNDFTDADGRPVPGAVLDAVSAVVRRGGREIGPSTPVVGRIEDEHFISTSPLRILANASRFALGGWSFTATAGRRRLVVEVDAPARRLLAGVTYRDPDGEPAYCYNAEVASLRLQVLHRSRRVGGWEHRATLTAPGRAHFEYGQREPVPGVELVL